VIVKAVKRASPEALGCVGVIVPHSVPQPSLCDNPILGHFHLIHTAKREEQLYQVLGRILGNSADNSAHGVSNCGVEKDRAHLYAGKICPHLLTWMQHAHYSRLQDRGWQGSLHAP
jgi:hypothetical protein